MKIAILEDDRILRNHLGKIIQKQGWQCYELESIDQLLDLIATTEEIDLFILDRMIGKTDSADSLATLKSIRPTARILILSSINLPEERAKWLMAGADEYMGKPVFSDELVARVHHLMRRTAEAPSPLLRLADLTIDKFKRTVSGSTGKIELTAKEYGLLVLLGENPGRVFNRMQILEHLWDFESDVETNVVESTINHLRRKLEQSHTKVEIKSKRNMGYWLEV